MTANQFKEDLITYLSTFDNILSCDIEMIHDSITIQKINGIVFHVSQNFIYELHMNFLDPNKLNAALFNANLKENQISFIYEKISDDFFKFKKAYSSFPISTFTKLLRQEGLETYTYNRVNQ